MKEEEPEMMKAKEIEIAPADVEKIAKEISGILYAEWADLGAQGCGGSARIYTLDGDVLIRYISWFPHKSEIFNHIYTVINYLSDKRWVIRKSPSEEVLEKLNEAVNNGKIPEQCFYSLYGGCGNYAWLNSSAVLILDDNNRGFTYRDHGKVYLIECSVEGVYSRIKRQLLQQLEELECDRDYSKGRLSSAELEKLQSRIDGLIAQLANVKEFRNSHMA